MLKTILIAGALLALPAAGLALTATAAAAQGWREPTVSCESGAIGCNSGRYAYGNTYGSDGGLGRYCLPGYYPHSSPDSNGIRCEPPGGTTQYIAPY